MKKLIFVLAIAVVIVFAFVAFGHGGVATAARLYQLPLPSISSGFQIQNLGTVTATVSLQYYDSTGASAYTTSDQLGGNASKSYFVPNVLPQPSGRYSLVVSSDQPLNVLVNEASSAGVTTYIAASHHGVKDTESATAVYMPWAISNYYGYDAFLAVQNAGSAAGDIAVDFYFAGTSSPQKTYTQTNVPVGGVFYLDLSQAPYRTDLPTGHANGFFGFALARSAQKLAAAVNYTDPTRAQLSSYNGVAAGGTSLVAPQVAKNYYGFNYGLTAVNLQSTPVTLTVSYYPSGATSPVKVQVVPVAGNALWNQYLGNVAGLPDNFNGSAIIQATGSVVGIATSTSTVGQADSYNLFPTSSANTTLYLPQIVRAYYGYEAGWQVVNTTATTATISIKYYAGGATTPLYTQPLSLGPNAAWTNYVGGALGAPLGTNFNGGVVISSDQPLVGIANFVAPNTGDSLQIYDAFTP